MDEHSKARSSRQPDDVGAVLRRLPWPVAVLVRDVLIRSLVVVAAGLTLLVGIGLFIATGAILVALTWLLGSPSGGPAVILSLGWFVSFLALLFVVTVRLWRRLPTAIRRFAVGEEHTDEVIAAGIEGRRERRSWEAVRADVADLDSRLDPGASQDGPSAR